MRIKSRRLRWILVLGGVAILPVGMTIAVVAAFVKQKPAPAGPRVVAVWASGPMEVRIALDQEADPSAATRLVGRLARFEPTRVAATGEARPGGDGGSVRVSAARLADQGRTLILATDPHPREATYALVVDHLKRAGEAGEGRSLVVTYTLAGVDATWTPEGGDKPTWAGWWPEFDPAAVRVALADSREHDRLWPLLKQPGKLALRSFVALPAGPLVATITSNCALEATLGTESAPVDPEHPATLKAEATAEPTEVTATWTTRAGGPDPTLRWTVAPAAALGDARPLARFPLGLAWAPPTLADAPTPPLPPALASGGDPVRGALVFAGEQAKCSNCHQVRGQGGHVGPDLSNLAGTSRAWIYHNIVEPSAAIHPDFLSYTVAFKDGRIGMGVVRAEGADTLRVGDIDAKFTTFPRVEVEEIRPSASSIMPVGLLGAIGEEQTRDLLAFLTSPTTPPAPAAAPSVPHPSAP